MKTINLKLNYRELKEIQFALAHTDILDYDTKHVVEDLNDKVYVALAKIIKESGATPYDLNNQ